MHACISNGDMFQAQAVTVPAAAPPAPHCDAPCAMPVSDSAQPALPARTPATCGYAALDVGELAYPWGCIPGRRHCAQMFPMMARNKCLSSGTGGAMAGGWQ